MGPDEFDRWRAWQDGRFALITGTPWPVPEARAGAIQIALNVGRHLSAVLPDGWTVHLGDHEIEWEDTVFAPDLLVRDQRGAARLVLDVEPPRGVPFWLWPMHTAYTYIETIADRLVVSERQIFVEAARRLGPTSWNVRLHGEGYGEGEIALAALTTSLSLDAIHEGVPLVDSASPEPDDGEG